MIYETDEDLQAIACGNIGGALMGDTLVVGLAEMGVPGHTGFALFRPDGDQTMRDDPLRARAVPGLGIWRNG